MRSRFRAFFEGMTLTEQRVLIGLIVLGAVGVGARYHATRGGAGFELIAQYDADAQRMVRVDGESGRGDGRGGDDGLSGQGESLGGALGSSKRTGKVGPDGGAALSASGSAASASSDRRLDINAATKPQLMALPGIGEVKAGRIVAYRGSHGPFKSADELTKVSGIGPKTLESLRPLVRCGGAPSIPAVSVATPGASPAPRANPQDLNAKGVSTGVTSQSQSAPPKEPARTPPPLSPASRALQRCVNINTADLAELDTLPGVGPVTARRIIAHRQTHGPFRNASEIERVKGIGPHKREQLRPLIAVE